MATSGFQPAPASDLIKFEINVNGNWLAFPRVRSDFKYEFKPIYMNVNTTQDGRTSQDWVRNQIVISNVNFDPCTAAEYAALSRAMHVGPGLNGGEFTLRYWDFFTGAQTTGRFIVKSLPVTVITVTPNKQMLRFDNVTFQEV